MSKETVMDKLDNLKRRILNATTLFEKQEILSDLDNFIKEELEEKDKKDGEKTKEKLNYITLYADETDTDVWEGYCENAEVSKDSTQISIFFDPNNVEAETNSDCENEDEDEDGNYLIVEEDGTQHYYDDEPDMDVLHGFVVGMGVDITAYKKTEDGEGGEVDSYHA